jgi:hypothetical protein
MPATVQVFQFIQSITTFDFPEQRLHMEVQRQDSCSAAAERDLIDDHELLRELEEVDQAPHLRIGALHGERDADGRCFRHAAHVRERVGLRDELADHRKPFDLGDQRREARRFRRPAVVVDVPDVLLHFAIRGELALGRDALRGHQVETRLALRGARGVIVQPRFELHAIGEEVDQVRHQEDAEHGEEQLFLTPDHFFTAALLSVDGLYSTLRTMW